MLSVHVFLCAAFHRFLLGDEVLPKWFPVGSTLLIPKSSDLSNPKNYWPIPCLNIVYKMWTGCLTTLMLEHCECHRLIHPAQKGCSRGQCGCVDHLLLANNVWHQIRCKNQSLSVAWIDYRKAYDSVPHNWLLECLRLFKFPPVLVSCIERPALMWKTTLFLHLFSEEPRFLSVVSVRCGIFQGDTLSPLLFCLSLNPLCYLLDELSGYKVTTTTTLTHLLYMDDLKLFATNDVGLQRLIDVVQMFSADIRMNFGIQKCAKLSIKQGKRVSTGPAVVLGNEIRDLSYGEPYRYLGFPECGGIDYEQSKETIVEFRRRLQIVWKSLLCGKFKVQATNSFCVPLLSYGFGVISWTKAEITKFDRLVRQVMTAANCHHPRSAIEQLHLPRKLGGRGLLCIEHLLERCIIMLSHHLQKSEDALVKMCCTLDSQLPPRGSIVSRASSLVSSLSLDNDFLNYSPGDPESQTGYFQIHCAKTVATIENF